MQEHADEVLQNFFLLFLLALPGFSVAGGRVKYKDSKKRLMFDLVIKIMS